MKKKKSDSLRTITHAYIWYAKGLGVVKWKEFNINCEQMNMTDSIITDVGDLPVFFNNR